MSISKDYIIKSQEVNNTFVQKSDILSYEEIMASTDLSGKIANANAIMRLVNTYGDVKGLPYYDYHNLGTSTNDEDFFKAWCNKIITDHKDKLGYPIIARAAPNSLSVVIGLLYNSSSPTYGAFLDIRFSALNWFGYMNGTWFWRNLY